MLFGRVAVKGDKKQFKVYIDGKPGPSFEGMKISGGEVGLSLY